MLWESPFPVEAQLGLTSRNLISKNGKFWIDDTLLSGCTLILLLHKSPWEHSADAFVAAIFCKAVPSFCLHIFPFSQQSRKWTSLPLFPLTPSAFLARSILAVQGLCYPCVRDKYFKRCSWGEGKSRGESHLSSPSLSLVGAALYFREHWRDTRVQTAGRCWPDAVTHENKLNETAQKGAVPLTHNSTSFSSMRWLNSPSWRENNSGWEKGNKCRRFVAGSVNGVCTSKVWMSSWDTRGSDWVAPVGAIRRASDVCSSTLTPHIIILQHKSPPLLLLTDPHPVPSLLWGLL